MPCSQTPSQRDATLPAAVEPHPPTPIKRHTLVSDGPADRAAIHYQGMSTRSPAVLFPAPQDETTAAVVAVCGPNREVVTYLMAVRTPDMATFYVVANLVEFTAQERAQTLRRLGRELVSRCLGRPRVFVGRAGMSLSQARNTLGELDLQVEHGHPSAMRVDSADPVGAVLRPGTVVLPSRPVTVATDGSFNPATGAVAAGFVTDTGLGRARTWRLKGIVEAEVMAILMALEAFPVHDLVVLTDSWPACRLVRETVGRRTRSLRLLRGLERVPSRLHGPLRRALTRFGGRVEVKWVRGHSGHRLNEAADRLVRATRREDEGIAVQGSAEQVSRNIREEMAT